MVAKACEYGIPALALTDHGNLYGAVEFYKQCISQNIRPIIGCEFYVAPHSRFEKKREKGTKVADHLILLCKNDQGYHNLRILSSLAFTEGFYYFPRIDKSLLEQHSDGLICLSACLSGSVARAALQSEEAVKKELLWFQNVFKEDFFSEVQLHRMSDEKIASLEEEWLKQEYYQFIDKQTRVNETVLQVSKRLGIPSVVTNDIHYLNPEDWLPHEILLNVQSGEPIQKAKQGTYIPNPKRKIYPSREYYFKSPQQMAELFPEHPEVLANTQEVAERCRFEMCFDKKHYPIYIPESLSLKKDYTEEERYHATSLFLQELCEKGLTKYTPDKLAHIARKFPGKDPLQVVKERLALESEIIISKGMSDYLLIVWDIINWAKANNIPVGPGRGSGAGSVMLFLLGITEIEPIRFDLFFERFINPERISYPDIDIDICMEGRERVINYAIERHGKENVAQIITFGTMKAKMAVKDAGRVLDIPLSKVNMIAKHIPDLIPSLAKALETAPDLQQLYASDKEATLLIDLASRLEGSVRNTGVHAAGVIICGEPLTNHIPICIPKDSTMITTQYSMKPSESVGMLKVDFLGLKTLTCIHIATSAIYKKTGVLLEASTLPLDDKTTFDLLHQGKTMGVFQMESKGMQELAKSLRPDMFEEIIAIGALYRPGPMDMIPSFINRKHGKEVIEYDHPLMEGILKETFGIMVYQEQVMQIAGTLANYSLGEGDVLRRAMGKKDAEQMEKERSRFCKRAEKNGINADLASAIFNKMERFASYGFNKSHAAAYGLITYTTAYLKANYPKEWLAALLTCDFHDIEKVAKLIHEAHSMDICVLPPDVNESTTNFVATEQGIRFAMSAIKGIGTGLVESIIEEREKNGPYQSVADFIQRSDIKKVTKKQTEHLIDAGCFDQLEPSRDVALATLDLIYDSIAKEKKEAAFGVMTFFSLGSMKQQDIAPIPTYPTYVPVRDKKEILKKEKELLGLYLTEHPLDAVKDILSKLSVVLPQDFKELPHGSVVRTVFLIDKVTTKLTSATMKKFAILQVSYLMDSYELPIWPDTYSLYQDFLEEDRLIYAILTIDKREDNLKCACRWMTDLTLVNEDVILECDKHFDSIKEHMQKMAYITANKSDTTQKKAQPKPVPKQQPMELKPITLSFDLEHVRHSHLFILKNLLRKHSGPRPFSLVFTRNSKKVATVSPSSEFFITASLADLQSDLVQAGLPITITADK